jgi:hypothetical protein
VHQSSRGLAVRANVHGFLAAWWAAHGSRRVRVRAVFDELAGKEPLAPACFGQDQLSPDELRALLAIKGWTIKDAASWWEMRQETLSRHIADPNRPRFIDDLAWGLAPYQESEADRWRRSLIGLIEAERRRTGMDQALPRGESVSSFVTEGLGFPGHLR